MGYISIMDWFCINNFIIYNWRIYIFLCNSISFNIWCKIKIKRFKNICLFKNIFLSLYLLNLKTIIMRRIGDKLVILDENGSYLVIGTFKMGSTGEYIDYSI